MKKTNILHITPHLGGGVGRVLLNYLVKTKETPEFEHQVICLDYANENAISTAKANNIKLIENAYFEKEKIFSEIENTDIVLVHWWNHPLLFDFLVRQPLPSSRVILWSHISGFHPPYVFSEKALSYPDLFVFTTPLSFETKEAKKFIGKDNLRTVWSTGGVEHVKSIQPKTHKGFNVGYLGTVDYCKIHPDFLKICAKINIPDIKFIVCGGSEHKKLEQEAKELGISDKFEFTGLISDISKYLEIFDVFGYPLAPYHYGTCDQVLAESMAAGVVPVVFNNKMENYMVKDKFSGLVAKTEEEYIKAVEFLYKNPDYRQELSQNARNYAQNKFSLENMANEWQRIFEELLNMPKTPKKWNLNKNNITPADVFIESVGNYGKAFEVHKNAKNIDDKNKAAAKIEEFGKSPLWQAKTRGTPSHYLQFFKDDKTLDEWNKIISI